MDKQRKTITIFVLICLCYSTLANESKRCDCELLQLYDLEDPNEFTCVQIIIFGLYLSSVKLYEILRFINAK